MPPGPVTQTLPRSSHLIPSTCPVSSRRPSAIVRPLDERPAADVVYLDPAGRRVVHVEDVSSGEKQSPFGKSRWSEQKLRLTAGRDAEDALEAELLHE